jgi:hypothetical protein
MTFTLPPLPDLTDAQGTHLVAIFTEMAAERGLPGPVECYIDWSIGNLVSLVRGRANFEVEAEVAALREQKTAEVNEMLADLLNPGDTP